MSILYYNKYTQYTFYIIIKNIFAKLCSNKFKEDGNCEILVDSKCIKNLSHTPNYCWQPRKISLRISGDRLTNFNRYQTLRVR